MVLGSGVDDVADDKQPVEKAVDLLVYAPVGMACYFRDMLPSMMGIFVARGKREVGAHRGPPMPPSPPPVPPEVKRRIDESMGVARYMAEGGLGVARGVAGSGFDAAREVAGSALAQFLAMRANGTGTEPPRAETTPPIPTPPASTPPASTPPASTTPRAARAAAPSPAPPPDSSWSTDVPASEALPIPDYDELSASQVVERLEGLDRDSLDAIRRYETEHRGRNTILGKIAQLG